MEINRKTTSNTKEIITSAAVILLLFLNLTPLNELLRDTTSFIFTPITFFSGGVASSVERIFDSISEISTLKRENSELKLEIAATDSENEIVSLLLEENSALRREVNLGDPTDNLVEAKVMAVGIGGVDDYLLINKGSESKVEKGDVVKIGNIFIGIVSDVEKRSAKVILPNSNASFLEVFVADASAENLSINELKERFNNDNEISKRFSGVAVGSSSGITIENISNDANIKNGDAVIVNDSQVNDFLYLGELGEVVNDPAASQKRAFVSVPINYQEINFVFVQIGDE